MAERPSVAVIVLVLRDGKVLLGKRNVNDETAGMFGIPGGAIEYGETIPQAAAREVKEETGLDISTFEFVGVTADRRTAQRHWVIIVLKADCKTGEPTVCESDKCESWEWFPIDALPEPLTPGSAHAIEALKSGATLIE